MKYVTGMRRNHFFNIQFVTVFQKMIAWVKNGDVGILISHSTFSGYFFFKFSWCLSISKLLFWSTIYPQWIENKININPCVCSSYFNFQYYVSTANVYKLFSIAIILYGYMFSVLLFWIHAWIVFSLQLKAFNSKLRWIEWPTEWATNQRQIENSDWKSYEATVNRPLSNTSASNVKNNRFSSWVVFISHRIY